ncbi:MAG: hypothetical protein OIF40_09295 [Mangrovicoccus sp.]|nr:hypothetical protein [Mangrovicoccus sp.]
MNSTVKLFAAAALALSVAAPLSAESAGETMLLSAVMNEVSRLGIETSSLDNLTLNDLVSIATIVRGDDPQDTQKRKVQQVIDSAN